MRNRKLVREMVGLRERVVDLETEVVLNKGEWESRVEGLVE